MEWRDQYVSVEQIEMHYLRKFIIKASFGLAPVAGADHLEQPALREVLESLMSRFRVKTRS